MRVFVAYGYNKRDKWIETMVFPILKAFNIEVVTGEEMAGEIISNEVRERIRSSEALIGFLTRREDLGNGKWSTHQWVSDEIAAAWGNKRKFIEVREIGVAIDPGSRQDRQFLTYDGKAKRDEFLVNLVKAVGRWSSASKVQTMLLPNEFSKVIRPIVQAREDDVICDYRFSNKGVRTDWQKGEVQNVPSGDVIVFINTIEQPYDTTLIEIRVQVDGRVWKSEWEQLCLLKVNMQQRGREFYDIAN